MTSSNKTIPTNRDVLDFIASLENEEQRRDSEALVGIMHAISDEQPVLWGTSIIGFGTLHYKYPSGREGDWMKIGFSPRKGKLSLYVTYDALKYKKQLDKVGKYKLGKGCIYINKLTDVDIEMLTKIIRQAYQSEDFLNFS